MKSPSAASLSSRSALHAVDRPLLTRAAWLPTLLAAAVISAAATIYGLRAAPTAPDYATSGGELVVVFGLVGKGGKEFTGDGYLGLTFGGIEVVARVPYQEISTKPAGDRQQ
jgi:hypothetical protein